jgi:hypothetical protein
MKCFMKLFRNELHFRAGFFLQMFDVQTGDHHKEDLDKFG